MQAGYGQADASSAYSQTQNVYAGYTQPTATEYYQTAATGAYQQNTAQQLTGAQQTAAQGWGVVAQQAGQQQQQQYWPTQQQAAAWPTTGQSSVNWLAFSLYLISRSLAAAEITCISYWPFEVI